MDVPNHEGNCKKKSEGNSDRSFQWNSKRNLNGNAKAESRGNTEKSLKKPKEILNEIQKNILMAKNISEEIPKN